MNRVIEEKDYWNKAALDPDVDKKYISDIDFEIPLFMLSSVKILEIGCGVGRLMKNDNLFYGIDISKNMIEIAKKRKPNCHFKVSDGRTIPYGNNFFQYVYSVLLFQHLPFEAISAYIKETARVLSAKGIFIFQFIKGNENEPFSIHHDGLLIKDELIKNGFTYAGELQYEDLPSQWVWVQAQKI